MSIEKKLIHRHSTAIGYKHIHSVLFFDCLFHILIKNNVSVLENMEDIMIQKLNTFMDCEDISDSIVSLKNTISRRFQMDEYDRIYSEHFSFYPDPKLQNNQRIIRGLEVVLHRIVFITYFRYMLFNLPQVRFDDFTEKTMLKLLEVNDFSIKTFLISCRFLVYSIDDSIKISNQELSNLHQVDKLTAINAHKYSPENFNDDTPLSRDNIYDRYNALFESEKKNREWCLTGEGEFFEMNRQLNIISDEDLEDIVAEYIDNEQAFDERTVVDGKSFYSKFNENDSFNFEISTKVNVGIYVFIGTKSVNISFDSIVNLLTGDERFVKSPVSFKLAYSIGGPHNGAYNIFKFFDHDVGHLFDIVKNFRFYNLRSIYDGLNAISKNPKCIQRRLINIFVWLYLFEYRTALGLSTRNILIVDTIKEYLADFTFYTLSDKYKMLNLDLDFFVDFEKAITIRLLDIGDRRYVIKYLSEAEDIDTRLKMKFEDGYHSYDKLQLAISEALKLST